MKFRKTLQIAPGKFTVAQKELSARILSRATPVYLIAEYPKSGGTWLKLMLAEALNIPAWTKGAPAWGACVMQAHWVEPKGKCRPIALFRDGRDVMVSYYFHSFFRNEFRNEAFVNLMRSKFDFEDFDDIRTNLPAFIRSCCDAPISPAFSWADFVRAWKDRAGTISCRYEDLRLDGAGTLSRLAEDLTGSPFDNARAQEIYEQYSMTNMRAKKHTLDPGAKNQKPSEVSFIRKGSVGGWSESFSEEALEIFEDRAGPELVALGYELGRPSTND